jgi:hypothetical protein
VEESKAAVGPIKYISLDRRQLRWEAVDLERLIAEDHPARLIWEVGGTLNLSGFEQEQKSREGGAGGRAGQRVCW